MELDNHPHPKPSKVAVVGAGIAGLACARALVENGFDVTLFEKSRGVGGRTSTRRVEPDLSFDHGAQYFTARAPRFTKFVEILKVQGCIAGWHGRIVKLENGIAGETSPQPRYVGVPGMSSLAAHMSKDLAVCREVRIERIVRSERTWELFDDTGKRLGPFDFLVLSLPAPQAVVLLGMHPFAAETAAVAMTPCWAVLVAFETRIDVPWDGAFVKESPLAWVARNSSKPGRPRNADCWVLHATPDWSAAHLEETPEAVGLRLLDAFGSAIGYNLPNTTSMTAHRWRYSSGADPSEKAVLFDGEAGLAVCGDWLSGGRIEGAFLSGTAAASSILRKVESYQDQRSEG